jgi:hypothetical protein
MCKEGRMNKKGESNNPLGLIIMALLVIILALVFITSTANTVVTQNKLITTSNESYNLLTNGCYSILGVGTVNISNSACNITVANAYPTGDWRLSESQCAITDSITNSTGTPLTLNTDYRLNTTTGKIQLLNTTTIYNSTGLMSNNVIKVNYNYCSSGYLTSSGDRSILGLLTTLMIVALIIILVGIVSVIWKNVID